MSDRPSPLAFVLAFAALLTITVILAGLAVHLAHSPPGG